MEPDYPRAAGAQIQDCPRGEPGAETDLAVVVADCEVAEDPDPPERHGADHPRQSAIRRLGHRPAGVAHPAQEVEGVWVRRPPYYRAELQNTAEIQIPHPPDANARSRKVLHLGPHRARTYVSRRGRAKFKVFSFCVSRQGFPR